VKKGIFSAWFVMLCLFAGSAMAEEGVVARGVYTTGVQDREPVDQITVVSADMGRVYFFTELRNLAGQRVTHRWEQGGQTVFEVPFDVGAARWRVWSSKEIQAGMNGDWTVVVVDGNGKELSRVTLKAPQ
jgi:hypothetical protein